jgi:uncharacterized protein YeaC (DUF1315 family)
VDYLQLIESMSPAVYRRLVRSVELGKWPDGNALTREQRENALQAIIAWGQRNLPEEERVGYLRGGKAVAESCDTAGESPLRWQGRE